MAELSETAVVQVERPRSAVGLIRLNRPTARNSLTFASWRGIDAALQQLCGEPDVQAIILAGAGDFFSAGGDVKTLPSEGFRATAPAERVALGHRIITAIRTAPVPVIAAVEGAAVGAGWSLALACDLIVASRTARFAAPFVKLGVVPDGGIAWFLTRRVGRHRAAALLLGDASLNADDALTMGLVNQVAEPGEAEMDAIALVDALHGDVPQAVEFTKALIDSAEAEDLSSFMRTELLSATLTQLGSEAKAARAKIARNRKD
ncbi:enoyl-CoA hydratase/isomerase family protein [Sphingomonadales bacterium 56]|uniref:enoyl-CoA hydratase/isomerase family protein n=1 Tax=unclassified Sphingobium TaxID=2611147 RepID=UPI00191B1FFC|nr:MULTISPECIES: enoyl-CoA hydratase/isomerase family protein [unclassified Sphingobium]MBY2929211.1 enoyl-CoA hydratase/isomerase family protein [Sphingomonadales bacterium 56]MBY2958877.1 enoyl-CoA hydratase/isomerase family protein [Sphingomonadales bacterium 58]